MDNIELQQGLNRVVQAKVERMINNKAPHVDHAIKRMYEEQRIAQDYIVPIGIEKKNGGTRPDVIFLEDGNILYLGMDRHRYSLHSHALGQFAEKLAIPSRYLRELTEGDLWQRKLATTILNKHIEWTTRNRVLIRAVGKEVRGVLSENYRRLNSVNILTAFLDAAIAQGGKPCDALMTDTKIYVETILPEPLFISTALNGNVAIYMGARFSTSDYGDGSVEIKVFMLNGVCLNGMVRESAWRQVHLGSKLPENIQLSEKTYQLDTQTTMSMVKDLTTNLYGKDNIRQKALEIKAASRKEVDFDKELKRLLQGGKLLKQETEGVQKLLMNNNPEDGLYGNPTLWKLTQGITAYARELAPERSRVLQELSGELLARSL